MSSKQSPERGHARRATNEALATSPGHAPKRGRTTSGETASALGCAAQRTRPTRSGTRFLPEASCPAGGELLSCGPRGRFTIGTMMPHEREESIPSCARCFPAFPAKSVGGSSRRHGRGSGSARRGVGQWPDGSRRRITWARSWRGRCRMIPDGRSDRILPAFGPDDPRATPRGRPWNDSRPAVAIGVAAALASTRGRGVPPRRSARGSSLPRLHLAP